MLQSGQNLLAGNRPTKRELNSVNNYLDDVKPVTKLEREYIQHKEDLVTMRPGRDHAWLDQCIEKCLHVMQGKIEFVHVRIGAFKQVASTLTDPSASSHPRSDVRFYGDTLRLSD